MFDPRSSVNSCHDTMLRGRTCYSRLLGVTFFERVRTETMMTHSGIPYSEKEEPG